MRVALLLLVLAAILSTVLGAFYPMSASMRAFLRRNRRRSGQAVKSCNDYVNKRCMNGRCIVLADEPDNAETFMNKFLESGATQKWACSCDPGYKTFYADTEGAPDGLLFPYCNSPINKCEDEENPCQKEDKNAQCRFTGPNAYQCDCSRFYTGDLCWQDVDECATCLTDPDTCPCKNEGVCNNVLQSETDKLGYTCTCKEGTAGFNCEIINEVCGRKPCRTRAQMGGAKEDACTALGDGELKLSKPETLFGYTCACNEGWTGINCELYTKATCTPDNCGSRGICDESTIEAFKGGYTCHCNDGYDNEEDQVAVGKFCTKEIDLCSSKPCRNDGTCVMLGPNDLKCICRPGYTSKFCESSMDPCFTADNQPKCLNGKPCEKIPPADVEGGADNVVKDHTQYRCQCGTAFGGTVCQDVKDPCLSKRCNELATCARMPESAKGYVCNCIAGFEKPKGGETDDDCVVKSGCEGGENNQRPCLNGAVCVRGLGLTGANGVPPVREQSKNFVCQKSATEANCPDSFEGKMCETLKIENLAADKFYDLPMKYDAAYYEATSPYFAVRGGVLDGPYLNLISGPVVLKKEKFTLAGMDAATIGTIFIIFKIVSPANGNIMKIHGETDDADAVFQIVSDYQKDAGRRILLKNLGAEDIILPQPALNKWNSILVAKELDGVLIYFNNVKILKIVTSAATGWGETGAPKAAKVTLGEDGFSLGIAKYITGPIPKDKLLELNLQNPKCQSMIKFDFLKGNLYSDDGCAQFDAEVQSSPDGSMDNQEAESIEDTFNGKSISMANLPKAGSCMKVPNFEYIFEDGGVGKEYGMKLEFKIADIDLTTLTNSEANLLLGSGNGPLSVRIPVQGPMGQFKLILTSDGESKEISVDLGPYQLALSRVIRVVINWDATADRGSSSRNLEISFMDNGRIMKRIFDMQGKMTRALWNNNAPSELLMGCAENFPFQLGTFHFNYERMFEESDVENFLKGQ